MFTPEFTDRLLCAWEALQVAREQLGAWSPELVAQVAALWAIDDEDQGEIVIVLLDTMESST